MTLTQGSSSGTGIISTTAQYAVLLLSGARTATRTVTLPASSKTYTVINSTTGGFAQTVGGLTILPGEYCQIVYNVGSSAWVKYSSSANQIASGGLYAQGAFSGTYTDGIVVDYTSTLGRISTGTSDGLAFYNGGVANTERMRLDSSGNLGVGVVPYGLSNAILSVVGNLRVGGADYIAGHTSDLGVIVRSSERLEIPNSGSLTLNSGYEISKV